MLAARAGGAAAAGSGTAAVEAEAAEAVVEVATVATVGEVTVVVRGWGLLVADSVAVVAVGVEVLTTANDQPPGPVQRVGARVGGKGEGGGEVTGIE